MFLGHWDCMLNPHHFGQHSRCKNPAWKIWRWCVGGTRAWLLSCPRSKHYTLDAIKDGPLHKWIHLLVRVRWSCWGRYWPPSHRTSSLHFDVIESVELHGTPPWLWLVLKQILNCWHTKETWCCDGLLSLHWYTSCELTFVEEIWHCVINSFWKWKSSIRYI